MRRAQRHLSGSSANRLVKVAFDFTVEAGQVRRLQFRADVDVQADVRRRVAAGQLNKS
jgi:hypothetical protein